MRARMCGLRAYEVTKFSLKYFREWFRIREIRESKDPRNLSAIRYAWYVHLPFISTLCSAWEMAIHWKRTWSVFMEDAHNRHAQLSYHALVGFHKQMWNRYWALLWEWKKRLYIWGQLPVLEGSLQLEQGLTHCERCLYISLNVL